jgi:hypothetical protein
MMKWRLLFDDYADIMSVALEQVGNGERLPKIAALLNDLKGSIQIDIESTFKNPGEFLNAFGAGAKNYDHQSIVYNGHPLLDGVANHSFWTMLYVMPESNFGLNHKTTSLIDHKLRTPYLRSRVDSLIAEAVYALLKRMACDVEYETDGMGLEEKRRRVNELTEYISVELEDA